MGVLAWCRNADGALRTEQTIHQKTTNVRTLHDTILLNSKSPSNIPGLAGGLGILFMEVL